VPLQIGAHVHAALVELAHSASASTFMVVQAALAVLLSRLGAGTDIALGAPVAGRTDEVMHELIGFFVNTLVLRADLSGGPSFRELLRRVKEACLGAYAHQDVPFEKLVEELQPRRELGRSPLFQVMFAWQGEAPAALELGGLRLRPGEVGAGTAKFELTLALAGGPGGLRGSLEYSTDLFDEATAARLVGHLVRLLEGIVAQPDRRLGEVPLLGEDERRQLLNAWHEACPGESEGRACEHRMPKPHERRHDSRHGGLVPVQDANPGSIAAGAKDCHTGAKVNSGLVVINLAGCSMAGGRGTDLYGERKAVRAGFYLCG